MSWLDLLLQETDFVETPKQWLYWSGIATISAIVAPNVYVEKAAYRLRPNLYILLMGRSGLGKGFGPTTARKLVKMVGSTRLIAGRSTIEGIIKELALSRASENGHIPFKDARGFICSGEFASSLYDSTSALTTLTDLYDSHDNEAWDNTLKNSPIDKLRFPCITLLSGANQDMFDLAVEKTHRTGGFVGRTLLIGAEKRFRANSMIYKKGQFVPEVNYEKLAEYLKELSKLTGEVAWSDDAVDFYDKWFYPYRNAEVLDKTGTYDRLNDHMIKVIACISLSRSKEMVITVGDVEEAIEACSSLSNTAIKVAGLQGKSSTSSAMKSFLVVMFSAEDYTLTRKQVLQKGFGDFDSNELDRVIENLTQMTFIKQVSGGKDIRYQITKAGVDWWQRHTGKKK